MQFSDDDNGIKKIIIVLHAQIQPSNLVLKYSLLRKSQQNKKTADVYDVFPHDKYQVCFAEKKFACKLKLYCPLIFICIILFRLLQPRHGLNKARSSHLQMFFKIVVLKNLAIFTGKNLCWSLFLIKLQAQACSFIKKRLQHRCSPVNIAKILRTTLQNTSGGCICKPQQNHNLAIMNNLRGILLKVGKLVPMTSFISVLPNALDYGE